MTDETDRQETNDAAESLVAVADEHPIAEEVSSPTLPEQPAEIDSAIAEDSAVDDFTATEPEALAEEFADVDEAMTGDVLAEEPASDDDVAAAIAEAQSNIEAEPTSEDTEPGAVAMAPTESLEITESPVAHAAATVSPWPFVVYDVLWAAFAGVLIWRFEQLPAGQAVFESSLYPLAVLGGIVLTLAGPLLILAVWVGSWGKEGSSKGGLFVSSLIRGSIATLAGVTLWWVALLVLDQLRLGRLL